MNPRVPFIWGECRMGKNPNEFAGIVFHTAESQVRHVQVELAHQLLPGVSPPSGWHHRQEPGPLLSRPALSIFPQGAEAGLSPSLREERPGRAEGRAAAPRAAGGGGSARRACPRRASAPPRRDRAPHRAGSAAPQPHA